MTNWETDLDWETEKEIECCYTIFNDENGLFRVSRWEDNSEYTLHTEPEDLFF